ncbi:MAG: 3-dehydroquinate synthase [Spirochaetales bacterium]|nr:3-dehydroquinate synthase [Spirochaetales bacterium]
MIDLRLESVRRQSTRVRSGDLESLAALVDTSRAVLVCDPEVRRLHGAKLPPCPVIVVPRGEEGKSFASFASLAEGFAAEAVDRGWTVVAVGGGAVLDLAGFAAATWLRGVDAVFVPSTLLAMADASVGGKNGLDLGGRKNQVGAFHAPREVLLDLSLLDTLPDAEFASGMAEALKHGVIEGGAHFAFLEGLRNGRPSGAALEELVARSVACKARFVEADPFEELPSEAPLSRRVLNLGHTIGHAIESATGLPHGLAVAAGLASICRFQASHGELAARDAERIGRLLDTFGLPASVAEAAALAGIDDSPSFRTRVAAALSADKKRDGSGILAALPCALGTVRVGRVALAELSSFVMEAP